MLTVINSCKSAVILFFLAAIAFSQTENGAVKVVLALGEGKTVYRTGEPIKLILSFTAPDGGGYQLNTTITKPASPIDEITVSPDSKVFHWLDLYSGANRYRPDYSAITNLSPAPAKVELYLNNWYRFDKPGHYSVTVKTRRVHATKPDVKELFNSGTLLSLTTNEVSFDIKPMSRNEEQLVVQRLTFLIDAAKDWQERSRYAEQFSFLTGDAAAQEKIERFFSSQNITPSNYYRDISFGLYISANKNLVIRLLEAKLRDPLIPATRELVFQLIGLRRMQQRAWQKEIMPADRKAAAELEQKRFSGIEQSYIKELIASLPKRSGQSLTTTAMSILLSLKQGEPQYNENLATVRGILLREFENLSLEFTQEYLLHTY